MAGRVYMAGQHHFHKAIKEITWPCSKDEFILRVGHKEVPVDWNEKKTIRELVEKIEVNNFENAAAFYNAWFASMY